jgi:type VI secretion system secreted protein Hcp
MKEKAIKAKFIAAVLVSTALILIAFTAGSGNLEPNAPPGPTMHTLEEIYGAITSPPEQEVRAFDMYMKIDGIPGESTDGKHEEWIEVLSSNWGVLGPGAPVGGGTLTEAEAKEFVVTKWMDKASPLLYLACCKGEHYPLVTLNLVEPTGERGRYMQFKMEDAMIVSVTGSEIGSSSPTSPAGSERPYEDISFNYGKIEWTYTVLDSNGAPTTQTLTTNFDFTTSTPY